jgi:hypothetical protein
VRTGATVQGRPGFTQAARLLEDPGCHHWGSILINEIIT